MADVCEEAAYDILLAPNQTLFFFLPLQSCPRKPFAKVYILANPVMATEEISLLSSALNVLLQVQEDKEHVGLNALRERCQSKVG